MATYAKVRRMRLREGLSISEIARRTGLARNTIKGWLRESTRSQMKYQRKTRPKLIDRHTEWLRQALETDLRRPRKERRTALKLFAQLKDKGFSGGYGPALQRMNHAYVVLRLRDHSLLSVPRKKMNPLVTNGVDNVVLLPTFC